MRMIEPVAADKTKPEVNTVDPVHKLYWPDLIFGPVNLWSLPSAGFFYRNFKQK